MPTLGDIQDIREGIAAALTAVDGLTATSIVGQVNNPPMAQVWFPDPILFDDGQDKSTLTIPVRVFIGWANIDAAAQTLADFMGVGARSIQAAINVDPTLAGACESLRCTRAHTVGITDIDRIVYLTATWDVEVFVPNA